MSLLPGNFLDAAHKYGRLRGGHSALWVFWALGGSQGTDAWEVSGTLELEPGGLRALSIILPSLTPTPNSPSYTII